MKNSIAFRHGFILPDSSKQDNTQLAYSLQAELMNLGYMLFVLLKIHA
jgi:hypothetical protein